VHRRLTITEAHVDQMELCYEDGFSTKQIGECFGILMGSAWARLKKRGVVMRPVESSGLSRRREHSNGYWKLDGEYVHRRIMERALGRRLRTDEHVHHKNGNKKDNRLENLELMTASEHHRLHARLNRRRSDGRMVTYEALTGEPVL
jgi:hypothetical protein